MSAVAGVFVRGGGPVPRGVVAHISGRQREMGPDAERFAWSGPVGMAHRVLHTEAGPRPHPFAQREGSLACMEGRVDNAGELTAALGGEGRGRAAAEVALAAYLQWGVEGLARLVGDFALALWDAPAGRLLLATDGMGRRPLYYRLTPESVCWASKSRPLAEALGLPPEPDDEFVAAFLANRPSAAGPIRGTAQLPGGHILVVERGRSELARYWSIDPDRRIEHRTDGEYEEHFREVFDQAVACRIQTDAPVFCELSGGLDSSTILSSADRLLKDGRAAAPSIHTVSYTFDQSSSSDERLYVRLMEEHVGRAGIHLSENDCPLLAPLPGEFLPDHPATELCFLERQDRVTREMQAAGSRVLLCGIGGDQAFWSTPPAALPLADLAARGRVVETLWRAGEWSRALRWPYLKTLWVGAVWPNLPRRWQARAQRQNPVGEWLAPEFVARMDLRERALSMSDDVGYCLPSASRQYGLFRQTMRTYALEWFSSEGYVDMRFPYLDRRLV
ncbi:MAG TPA: asparagine synthase-related protein, partial [Longimicrobium sp.]|nr:asparagine synthase-related protein [Longimicrobium sp.]